MRRLYDEQDRETKASHVAMWGGFNDAPPAMEQSDFKRFWHIYSSSQPRAQEYRQFYHDGKKVYAYLYFDMAGTNFAVEAHNHERVWQFGCQHKNTVRKEIGRCLNKYTCQDCGHVETIDSSD